MSNKKELRYMGYNFSRPGNITISEAMKDSGCKTVKELQEKASNGPLHLHYGHSGGIAYQVVYHHYPEGKEEGKLLINDVMEEKPKKEIIPLEKFTRIASELNYANYYTDKGWTIPKGTGPNDETIGKALMQDYLKSDYQTLQEWENHLDNSLTESNEYYDMWEELFSDEEPEEREKQNYITFRDYKNLTDEDIWTTDAISCEFALIGKKAICSKKTSSEASFFVPAETIPENLFNDEDSEKPTEETANKKPMPEHVRNYLTFEELPLALQNKVIRKDKLFSNKNGFKIDPEEIKTQLYHLDGRPACMTIQERKDWYASGEKTETVYKYRLSPDWSSAVVWGKTFEQALSRRGKLYEKYHIVNGAEMQGKTIIINKIIEVKQTEIYSYVLGEKTGPFPGFIATVELEDGRITEVSAVVEDSLILR